MQSLERLPWHRRLSFRLAALIATVLVAFDLGSPFIQHGIGDLVGIRVQGEYYIECDSDETKGIRWELPEVLAPLTKELLAQGPSSSEADHEKMRSAVREWHNCGNPCCAFDYYVTDASLHIRTASPRLGAVAGANLDLRDEAAAAFRPYPIRTHTDAQLHGWLFLVRQPYAVSAAQPRDDGDPTMIVLSESEAKHEIEVAARISTIVSWTLRAGIAFSVALFVSWFVTRRLVRLAQSAQRPLCLSSGSPGPSMVVRGSDEIANLSVALQEARGRIASLIAELGERDEKRREWIAQVSHDLRTPLTALIARLDRAERALEQATDDASACAGISDAVRIAKLDARRVGDLASDLLEAARLELPDALHVEELLVGELLGRAITELRPLADHAGLKLNFIAPPNLPTVDGDGNRLLRVLENLIRNAIEHAASEVTVRATLEHNEVAIAIEDDGPGLAGGPRRTPRRRDSTGLGLRISRMILSAHGSNLELADAPIRGTISGFRMHAGRRAS